VSTHHSMIKDIHRQWRSETKFDTSLR